MPAVVLELQPVFCGVRTNRPHQKDRRPPGDPRIRRPHDVQPSGCPVRVVDAYRVDRHTPRRSEHEHSLLTRVAWQTVSHNDDALSRAPAGDGERESDVFTKANLLEATRARVSAVPRPAHGRHAVRLHGSTVPMSVPISQNTLESPGRPRGHAELPELRPGSSASVSPFSASCFRSYSRARGQPLTQRSPHCGDHRVAMPSFARSAVSRVGLWQS